MTVGKNPIAYFDNLKPGILSLLPPLVLLNLSISVVHHFTHNFYNPKVKKVKHPYKLTATILHAIKSILIISRWIF